MTVLRIFGVEKESTVSSACIWKVLLDFILKASITGIKLGHQENNLATSVTELDF